MEDKRNEEEIEQKEGRRGNLERKEGRREDLERKEERQEETERENIISVQGLGRYFTPPPEILPPWTISVWIFKKDRYRESLVFPEPESPLWCAVSIFWRDRAADRFSFTEKA